MTTAGDCQNCGTVLSGAYCTACGQKADVRILSLPAFIVDVASDLCDFDARIWRSLRTLAFRPGRLTRLYLEGQRAKYTPPFRMYVITSLAFFVDRWLRRSRRATQSWPAPKQRLEAACERVEATTPPTFNREFADNFPVTMLVFIPIVAAIMKLLYLFTRPKFVEHLLFFVHVHTFFFVVGIVTVLLSGLWALGPVLEVPLLIVSGAAWLYFLVYLYLAMREVYGQSHRLTAVKYVVLGGSYLLAAVLTLLGAAFFTAVTL